MICLWQASKFMKDHKRAGLDSGPLIEFSSGQFCLRGVQKSTIIIFIGARATRATINTQKKNIIEYIKKNTHTQNKQMKL